MLSPSRSALERGCNGAAGNGSCCRLQHSPQRGRPVLWGVSTMHGDGDISTRSPVPLRTRSSAPVLPGAFPCSIQASRARTAAGFIGEGEPPGVFRRVPFSELPPPQDAPSGAAAPSCCPSPALMPLKAPTEGKATRQRFKKRFGCEDPRPLLDSQG